MLASDTVGGQYRQWNRVSRNRDIIVEMLSPGFTYRGSKSAYFALVAYDNAFTFSLGVDSKGNLEPYFEANISGNCVTSEQCAWNQQMEWFMADIEDVNLGDILDASVDIARKVFRRPDKVKIPRQNLVSDIEELFTYTMSRPHGLKITPETMTKWTVLTRKNILCSCEVKRVASGVYGEVNVILPRLALGGNVDIGGVVTYPGLVASKTVRNYKDVCVAIAEALDEERSDVVDTPYNSHEAEVCRSKQIVAGAPLTTARLLLDDKVKEDHVGLPEGLYFSEISKRPDSVYLFVRLTSALGITGWYVAQPENIRLGSVVMSHSAMINLNAKAGETVFLTMTTLSVPSTITVRPRARFLPTQEIDEQELIESFSLQTVASLGHTYTLDTGVQVDIIDIEPRAPACLLRSDDFDEVLFYVNYDIYPSAPLLDPLAIDDYSYDTESDSD